MTIRIAALIFLFPLVASAFEGLEQKVVIDQEQTSFTIGPRWSHQTRQALYGGPVGAVHAILGPLVNETPLSAVGSFDTFVSDFSGKSQIIARECRRLNPAFIWRQISCVARSVDKTLDESGPPRFSTPCRSRAQAFIQTFRELRIPKSRVSDIDGSDKEGGHVLNRIAFIDKNGRYLAYAIDVGWEPTTLYPLTEITQRFHEANGGRLGQIGTP